MACIRELDVKLNEWETRYVLESLSLELQRLKVLNAKSDDEDVAADAGNDFIELSILYERLLKSAVAFFNMVFSRSRRFTRASSSCMRCCSGVNALDLGVLPPRSDSSCRTHLRRVFSCTFLLKLLMNGLNRSNYFRAALQPFFLCKGDDNF